MGNKISQTDTALFKCPYPIPEIRCPDPASLRQIQPFSIWEFLRVEALLRSPVLWRFYRQGKRKSESALWARYKIKWDVLNSSHHVHLDPTKQFISPQHFNFPSAILWHDCIIDLEIIIRATERAGSQFLTVGAFMEQYPHALFLMINPLYPTKTILERIDGVLVKKRKALPVSTRKHYKDWHYAKRPDLRTWFNYLACYDLTVGTSKPNFRSISRQVYSNRGTAGQARTAFHRVKKLITNAAANDWPPNL